MRFLVDENAGPSVAGWLRRQGHEVFSVYEAARGVDDEQIRFIAISHFQFVGVNSLRSAETIRFSAQSSENSITAPVFDIAELLLYLQGHFLLIWPTVVTANSLCRSAG